MVISEDILFSHGAKIQAYSAGDYIFHEGTAAKNYLQIHSGTVKLNNFMEDGKEFVHGFPFRGHCIGESYLFTENLYGINAVAVTACEIIRLEKEIFLKLIRTEPDFMLKVNRYTADRLHFRYLISTFLSITDPLIKLQKLLDHIKGYFGFDTKFSFEVQYTRSQLATLAGLRVETVIRTIKKMEAQNLVKIQNSKIFY